MSNYVFAISPVIDSISLKYPEIEIPTLKGTEIGRQVYYGSAVTVETLNLSLKEDTDKIQSEWIKFGLGRIEFASDGKLYIKIPFAQMQKCMENTLNLLKDYVKTLTPLDLATSGARYEIENLLDSEGVEIINFAESTIAESMSKWLYSEYERFHTQTEFKDADGNLKDLSDLVIVYQIHQAFEYNY